MNLPSYFVTSEDKQDRCTAPECKPQTSLDTMSSRHHHRQSVKVRYSEYHVPASTHSAAVRLNVYFAKGLVYQKAGSDFCQNIKKISKHLRFLTAVETQLDEPRQDFHWGASHSGYIKLHRAG
ncbi:hypothetical protein RRG08_038692 [Elysia crispata]|uniref:Uncharacterized protein n=1 Tax=Elysia crispata TaxID=231223 RepID=A0AAE0ZJP8_9GAST|nr:hypothetical protein RRG08_038692 [Elysia crispata]